MRQNGKMSSMTRKFVKAWQELTENNVRFSDVKIILQSEKKKKKKKNFSQRTLEHLHFHQICHTGYSSRLENYAYMKAK